MFFQVFLSRFFSEPKWKNPFPITNFVMLAPFLFIAQMVFKKSGYLSVAFKIYKNCQHQQKKVLELLDYSEVHIFKNCSQNQSELMEDSKGTLVASSFYFTWEEGSKKLPQGTGHQIQEATEQNSMPCMTQLDQHDIQTFNTATKICNSSSNLPQPFDRQVGRNKFRLAIGTLKFPAGKLTVISGDGGSGKSSLLYSLFGEMVYSDDMSQDGQDEIKPQLKIDVKVSFIEQNPYIMNTTLQNNICLDKRFDEALFTRSLRKSGIDKLEHEFNQGAETILSNNGSAAVIDNEVKTKVNIARAIYQDNKIILIDDVFKCWRASGDECDISWFIQLIQETWLGKTVVLVSNDPRLVDLADHSIILKNGSILKQGKLSQIREELPLQNVQTMKKTTIQHRLSNLRSSFHTNIDSQLFDSINLYAGKRNSSIGHDPLDSIDIGGQNDSQIPQNSNHKQGEIIQEIFEIAESQEDAQLKLNDTQIPVKHQPKNLQQATNQNQADNKQQLLRESLLPQGGYKDDKSRESIEATTKNQSQQLLEQIEKYKLLKKFQKVRGINVQELSKFYVDSNGYIMFSLVYAICQSAVLCEFYGIYGLLELAWNQTRDPSNPVNLSRVLTLMILVVQRSIAVTLRKVILNSISANSLSKHLHARMSYYLLHAPINSFFSVILTENIAEIFDHDIEQVETQMLDQIGRLIQQVSNFVTIAFVIALTVGKTSLLYLIVFAVVSHFTSVRYLQLRQTCSDYSWPSEMSVYHRIQDSFQALTFIRSSGLKSLFGSCFLNLVEQQLDLKSIQDGLQSYFTLRFELIALLIVHLPSYALLLTSMLSPKDQKTSQIPIRFLVYTLIAPRISEAIKDMHKSMTMMSSNFMSLSRCYLFDGIKIPKDYRYFEEDKAEHITGDLKRIQRQVEYEASNFKETYVQEIESLELSNIWARFFGDENFQLKGINISIKGGEKIAIIGSLDSGPSALVWVLTKIIDPEFGDYRFNGDLVTGVDTKVLRRQFILISGSAQYNQKFLTLSQRNSENSDLNFTRFSQSIRKTMLKSISEEKEEIEEEGADLYEGFFENIEKETEKEVHHSNVRIPAKTNHSQKRKQTVVNRATEQFEQVPITSKYLIDFDSSQMQLFEGTLIENIDPLALADRSDVINLLHDLEFFEGYEGQIIEVESCLDMMLGKKGINLTELQYKKLQLLRGLLKNSNCVIIQEEALNWCKNLERMRSLIEATFQNKTIIYLTSSRTRIQKCDKFYAMDEGEIILQGEPSELASSSDPKLRDLWSSLDS